jgi:hypothetical protein
MVCIQGIDCDRILEIGMGTTRAAANGDVSPLIFQIGYLLSDRARSPLIHYNDLYLLALGVFLFLRIHQWGSAPETQVYRSRL